MSEHAERISIEQFDHRTVYCRMLGHELTFKYCRSTADGRFCRKIFDCWHSKIDIFRFVKSNFTEDEIQEIIHPPASKVETLINLINSSESKG